LGTTLCEHSFTLLLLQVILSLAFLLLAIEPETPASEYGRNDQELQPVPEGLGGLDSLVYPSLAETCPGIRIPKKDQEDQNYNANNASSQQNLPSGRPPS